MSTLKRTTSIQPIIELSFASVPLMLLNCAELQNYFGKDQGVTPKAGLLDLAGAGTGDCQFLTFTILHQNCSYSQFPNAWQVWCG